jgi:Arylsulfotransferase (ASST)
MNRAAALLALVSLVFLGFVAGLGAAYLKTYPYHLAVDAWETIKVAIGEPDRLVPKVHDFSGVRHHEGMSVQPGLTLVTSYFPENDWNAGARLIDADGAILHNWNIDVERVFGRNLRLPYIHGSYLFPNGDLLVSYEFVGLARVTACGEPIWVIGRPVTHHSVSPDSNGGFWVSANRTITGPEGRSERMMLGLSFPIFEDIFLHVDANGETLQSINSIEVFEKNGLAEQFVRMNKRSNGDIFHLNDIEELSPAMAAAYPMFAAGDILVSLRDLHMVMVLDPATLKVKWYTTTDTIFQHDADFIGDGWIGIFDNRFDASDRGEMLGGSRILAVRPDTDERKVLFPTEASPPFYTKWSGKWQILDNGNLLLTEARAGRALEVTSGGAPVWEWVIDSYDAETIPEIMEASRYALTAEEVATWPCSPASAGQ